MKQIFRIAALLAILGGGAAIAWAQQSVKMPKAGYISASDAPSMAGNLRALRQGLKELGYVEGKNITLELRFANGRIERLPELAADLVRQKVDVIVTAGPSATRAARQVTSSVPIVMVFDPDPVNAGFVASLAQPGGNITGSSSVSPDLIGKQMELLKMLVPKMSRIAVLGNSTEPGNPQALKEAESAARTLGLQLVPLDARESKDVEPALDAAAKANADAIVVLATPPTTLNPGRFRELVAKRRLPSSYYTAAFVASGGLMSYSAEQDALSRRAAAYVDKILKGRKPAELPVEQPGKFELVINLKAAKEIGLTVPSSLIARADRIID